MPASNYIHIEIDEIKRVTDKAILIVYDGTEIWLPKSQVADCDNYQEGDLNCTISITEWIANEKGLEGD